MSTPYQRPSESPRDSLVKEIRLCFATAGGCLAVGGAAFLYGLVRGDHVSLVALLPVAGFYGLMGVERLFRIWRMDAKTLPVPQAPEDIAENTPPPRRRETVAH